MDFLPILEYLKELFPELDKRGVFYINIMPSDPRKNQIQVLFRDVYSGITIDRDIPGYRHGRFRMAVRGYNYNKTRKIASDIAQALNLYVKELGTLEIKRMRPLAEPVGFMTSEGGYSEFYVNFYTVYGFIDEPEEPQKEPEEPEEPSDPEDESSDDTNNG